VTCGEERRVEEEEDDEWVFGTAEVAREGVRDETRNSDSSSRLKNRE
jgi:hypothetical protein